MINKINANLSKKTLFVNVFLLTLAILTYVIIDNNFLAVVVGVAQIYLVLRKILSKNLFQSKIYIFIVSLIAYMGSLQMLTYVTWQLMPGMPITVSPLILQILSGLLLYYLLDIRAPNIILIKKTDMASILAATVFISLITFIPMYRSINTDKGNILNLMNMAVDDSAHYGMLNDRLQFKQAVAPKKSTSNSTARHVGEVYPAGWHNANATIILALKPNIKTGVESLYAYIITRQFWSFILVYLLGASGSFLLSRRKRENVVSAWIFASTLLFSIWFVTGSIRHGFYNYIGVLSIVPPFLLAIVQLAKAKNMRDLLWALILPITLISVAILSWILVSPIFILIILFFTINTVSKYKMIKEIKNKNILKPLYINIVLAFLLSFSFFTQFSLTSKGTDDTGGFLGSIMIGGGIEMYPIGFYIILLIGLIPLIYLAFLKRPLNKHTNELVKSAEIFIITLAIGFLFVAVIYVLQMYKMQHLAYYFYKTFYVVVFLIIIGVIAGGTYAVNSSNRNSKTLLAGIVLFLLFSTAFLYPEPSFITYVRHPHATSKEATRVIYNELLKSQDASEYQSLNITAFATASESSNNSEVSTQLVRNNKPYSRCYSDLLTLVVWSSPDAMNTDQLNELETICAGYNITLYVEPIHKNILQSTVHNSNLSNNITIRAL